VGGLEIDSQRHTVQLEGRAIELSPREFDVLRVLARDAGCVLSVDDILKHAWGAEFTGESQVVYVHIRWLREKLEEDSHHPKRIVSVRGVGYKLDPEQF
jgi:DNA-binding response OmpR family regulator